MYLLYIMTGYFIYYQLASFKEAVLAGSIKLNANNIDFYEEALKSREWQRRIPEITGSKKHSELTFSEFILSIKRYHSWDYLKVEDYKKLHSQVQNVMHQVCNLMSHEFTKNAINTVRKDVDITSLSEIYFAELVIKELKQSTERIAFANMEKIGAVVYADNNKSYIKKTAFDSIDSR